MTKKARPTLAEQWRAYGSRPLAARYTARAFLLLGVGLVVGVVAGVLVALAYGVVWAVSQLL